MAFNRVQAQGGACTQPGQTPATAFPVCGISVFEQKEVPLCGNTRLVVPGCGGAGGALYTNKNPYWYKFTCFESGTLGFTIQPKDPADDYDWQLYDITGVDPNQVFTNPNIVVTGNWAGNPGSTGTSANGVSYIQCASPYTGTESRFAQMPQLIAGHEYLLLVSHFTETQSGYDLSFGGGTAVINDPRRPGLLRLNTSCDATKIFIKTDKKVKCSSIAADGSDFIIPGSDVRVVSARAHCSGFDTDSIMVQLDRPLPPGQYQITVRQGTDGNTMLDYCDFSMPAGQSLPVRIVSIPPTPMDSLRPVACAPTELHLVFKKRIRCASVASNGANFSVEGPEPVEISGIRMNCDAEGMSNGITLQLRSPLSRGGDYRIVLRETILDECLQPTPVNSSIGFSVKDTVNADFSYTLTEDCEQVLLQFAHNGSNGVSSWNWQLDQQGPSMLQAPSASFKPYGKRNISLVVSNGFCSDTVRRTLDLGERLRANFEVAPFLCPEDSLFVLNKSTGRIATYQWLFGDGETGTGIVPAGKRYKNQGRQTDYTISLIVQNAAGCADTLTRDLTLLMTCRIDVPNAFTPNGDHVNDNFQPLNAFKADEFLFRIYNRAGQLLFETTDWRAKWDGTYKDEPQSAGVYAWTLQYRHRDTGQFFQRKGSVTLIR